MTQEVDSKKAIKRLEKELKKFKNQKLPNVDCSPSKDNKLVWVATVTAPVSYQVDKFNLLINTTNKFTINRKNHPMKEENLKQK